MGVKIKRVFHKFFKIFIILMIGTLAINLLLLAIIYGSHVSKKKKEDVYMIPPGEMVEVNGHFLHVLEGGDPDGTHTLVFMHNTSIVDDSIALRPLYDELAEYRLILVERSGSGFSENSGADRDIDTILDETRKALEGVGAEGPYILVPNGASGIEAIYWADKYPEEVEAIIGIGMNYPAQYASITTEEYAGFFDYLMVKFCGIGGLRLVKNIFPSNDYELYTEMEMNIRNALIAQRGYTMDIFNERERTIENAQKVAALGWPEETKMYLIYSNPLMEPYLSLNPSLQEQYEEAEEEHPDFNYVEAYNAEMLEYVKQYKNVTTEEVDGPARLYLYNPEEQADLMRNYIENNLE